MNNPKIAIIGLGYVGLPLAVEFAKKYKVIGFDINSTRVDELCKGEDHTLEISSEDLKKVLVEHPVKLSNRHIGFLPSADVIDISTANIYIVTVPTPVDKNNRSSRRIPMSCGGKFVKSYSMQNMNKTKELDIVEYWI